MVIISPKWEGKVHKSAALWFFQVNIRE